MSMLPKIIDIIQIWQPKTCLGPHSKSAAPPRWPGSCAMATAIPDPTTTASILFAPRSLSSFWSSRSSEATTWPALPQSMDFLDFHPVIAGVFVPRDGCRPTKQESLRKSIFKLATKNYSNTSPFKNWKITRWLILIDTQTYPTLQILKIAKM